MNINFFNRVYEVVRRIPLGKVATYGLIADILDTKDARRVGHALHANPDGSRTPCHRVVFSDGSLASGYAFGGPNEQRRKLELEGIMLDANKVNLTKYLWRPDDTSSFLIQLNEKRGLAPGKVQRDLPGKQLVERHVKRASRV